MKKKNGFTLVELLITITLMLTILVLAIISFNKVSKNKKDESWKTVKLQVEAAATDYFIANEYLFEGLSDRSSGSITVGKLVQEDYLGKVIDPRDGTSLDECSEVSVTKEGSKYIASFNGNTKVAKVDGKCENKNLVETKDVGGPSGEVNYYKENGTTKLSNDGWFNITKLGERGKLKVCIKPDTKGNGAIASAKIDGIVISTKEANGYCTTIENDINKSVDVELENILGKKWIAKPTIRKDTKYPSCSYNVSGGTIGNKVGDIQWYKKGNQPRITYTGNDEGTVNSGVDGIYQYKESELVRKSSANTYSENITSRSGYYNAVVKDKAGNQRRCGSKYGYDNTSPSCSIEPKTTNKMKNGWFKGPAYFETVNISGDVDTWTWNTDQWNKAPTYEFSKTKPNDITNFYVSAVGNRTVTINMTDIAGNTGTCSKGVTIYQECSQVTYEDGNTCSETCGGGTKNRLAYDKYTDARCSSKDLKEGGDACNTKSCTTKDVCSNMQNYVSISSSTHRTKNGDGRHTKADGDNYTYVDFNFNINNSKISKVETHAAFCGDKNTCLAVKTSNKNQTQVKCFSKWFCESNWEYVGASIKVKCGSTTKTLYYSHQIGTSNTWTKWE